VKNINSFLNYLCETSEIGYTGTIYALDGLDMTMTYVLTTYDFSQNLLKAILSLDVFPRPTGVGLKVHINYGFQWGFNAGTLDNYENTNKNFGFGNFVNPFISNFLLSDVTHQIMEDEDGEIMLSETGEVMVTNKI